METVCFAAVTACAMFGFVYGLVKFFREPSALYSRMIVFGIGCTMLGRLFETLQVVVAGEIREGFHVGVLGTLGSFLFFLTANYGQMALSGAAGLLIGIVGSMLFLPKKKKDTLEAAE